MKYNLDELINVNAAMGICREGIEEVLKDKNAVVAVGEASGETPAVTAIKCAYDKLCGKVIRVIVFFETAPDTGLDEMQFAADYAQKLFGEKCKTTFGFSVNPDFKNKVKVTLFAN